MRDFPGGPVAETHGDRVQSLVRELDPTCHTKSSHGATKDLTCHHNKDLSSHIPQPRPGVAIKMLFFFFKGKMKQGKLA